jgi:hypothetical protein
MIRRLAVVPFEAAIAITAVLTGILAVAVPEASGSVAEAAPSLARLWGAMYGIAGLLILGGLLTGRVAGEALGLVWMAGTIIAATIADVLADGPDIASVGVAFRLLVACAALLRVQLILQHVEAQHEVEVEVDG